MATKGGGKIKIRGEHSPSKPYERKSFFQRITDSIKDVLRPSWLASESDEEDVSSLSSQSEDKPITSATFQKKKDICSNKDPTSENAPLSKENPISLHTPQPDAPVSPASSADKAFKSSGSSSGLWSVTSGGTSGLHQQISVPSFDGPDQMVTGKSTALGSSGSCGRMHNVSHRGARGSGTRRVLQPLRGDSSLTSAESSRLNRSALHSMASPPRHVSLSNTSLARQQQVRQRPVEGGNSFCGAPESVRHATASTGPSKRQRLWTPEASRKGRSLQPAVHDQPAFKMSVFRSSSLREAELKSPLCLVKTNYGESSSYRRQHLNNSLPFQDLPPVRMTVTPKPVSKTGGAVLSSSTTQILRTLERMSDTKRAKVGLRDSESLLSFTPPSYRKSRPLQKNDLSHSKESCVETSNSDSPVSAPATSSEVPALSAGSAQKVSDEVVIAADSSDDDDIQIIETRDAAGDLCKSNVALKASQAKKIMQGICSIEKQQQQMDRGNDKTPQFQRPVKATPSPSLSTSTSQLPVAGEFASSPSAFVSPPAWGSTAPKPKSIIAGNSKLSTSNRKSVSFSDNSKVEDTGGFAAPTAQLRSGSVMDILGKSSEHSPSEKFKESAASSAPAGSEGDSLFAKLAAPPGSWECEVCMLHNTPDLSHCIACQAGKPGPAQKETAPVARGASTGGPVFNSPSFGASSGSKGCFGGVQLESLSSTPSVPISGGFNPPTTLSGSGGFRFGISSSSTSSFPAFGGFKVETSVPETTSSLNSAGFTFGTPVPASTNKITAACGFQFGARDSSDSQNAQNRSWTIVSSANSSSALTSTGFQLGASSLASSVSDKTTTSGGLFTNSSATVSNSPESGRTQVVVSSQCEKNGSNTNSNAGELISSSTLSTDSSNTNFSKSGQSLLSDDQVSDSAASTAQTLPAETASSTVKKGFHFSETINVGSSSPFVFGSSAATELMVNGGSDSCVKQSMNLKTSFSFGASAKSEQSTSSAVSSASQNGLGVFAPNTTDSKGFVFGASCPSATAAGQANGSNSVFGNEFSSSATKSVINGKAEAGEKSAFGEESPAIVGFSFGVPLVQSEEITSGQSPFIPAEPPSLFGAQSSSEGTSYETIFIDNDVGQNSVVERQPEKPAVDSVDLFKFASPKAVDGSNTTFKFGQELKGGKEADLFNSQTSGTTGKKSGFGFSTQTNGASSKELPPSQAFALGGGSGNTNTGQFSFSVGAGSQSNAAAASSLSPDVSAPKTKGFNFSGAAQSSFSFGADNTSNCSTSLFQFASPKSVDAAPTQSSSSSGMFTFGQLASSAKNFDPAPLFAAPTTNASSGAATLGTGEGPRKLKRAVRRVPRQ